MLPPIKHVVHKLWCKSCQYVNDYSTHLDYSSCSLTDWISGLWDWWCIIWCVVLVWPLCSMVEWLFAVMAVFVISGIAVCFLLRSESNFTTFLSWMQWWIGYYMHEVDMHKCAVCRLGNYAIILYSRLLSGGCAKFCNDHDEAWSSKIFYPWNFFSHL